MSATTAAIFEDFRRLLSASSITLYARGSGVLWDAWKYFSAMPAPTPPHWWRYSTKTQPHEHVIDGMAPVDKDPELWDHHHYTTRDEEHIASMLHNPRFLNEREAEVFIIGSLLREVQEQDKLYETFWNHAYGYVLQPAQDVAETLASDRAYVCTLMVTGRGGGEYANTDVPPPPDVGSDVTINDNDREHQFSGFVQTVDEDNTITMIVTITKGSAAFVLNDRRGVFRFGNSSQAFVTAKKSIQKLLWSDQVPGFVPWIRTLVLAHENQAIPAVNPPAVTGPWRRHFPQLNPRQELALRKNAQRGRELRDKLVMIQGPPGTGKTEVIAQTCVDCLTRGRKFLVVAETRYAVKVAADAIENSLVTAELAMNRVFHVEHTGVEGMSYGLEEVAADDAGGAPWGSHDEPDMEDAPTMSETSRLKVISQLQVLLKPKSLSLDAYMRERLDLFKRAPGALHPAEKVLVLEVVKYRKLLQNRLLDPDDIDKVYKNFRRCWAEIQEYYLRIHSVGIIVTAATSMHKIIRSYRPDHLLLDEGSQMAEHTAVAVIARFFGSLNKVSIFGDIAQIGVFHASKAEFVQTTAISFMERMIGSGLPYVLLNEQYRMHPHISMMVSTLFYAGKLINHGSVQNRPADAVWDAFTRRRVSACHGQHSIFLHVPPGTMYRSTTGYSTVNPSHLVAVNYALDFLKEQGAEAKDIAVFTFYKAQLRLLRKLPEAVGVMMSTVDGAQGKEYPFIILDLVKIGGRGFSLGFITDVRRMCVGLSRAQNGLLILGNQDMIEGKHMTQGTRKWDNLVKYHRGRNAIKVVDLPAERVEAEVVRHGLRGEQYSVIEADS